MNIRFLIGCRLMLDDAGGFKKMSSIPRRALLVISRCHDISYLLNFFNPFVMRCR